MTSKEIIEAIGELAESINAADIWDRIAVSRGWIKKPRFKFRWPGLTIVQAEDGKWDVRSRTHFLSEIEQEGWLKRSDASDVFGSFKSYYAALNALNNTCTQSPPLFVEETRTFQQIGRGLIKEIEPSSEEIAERNRVEAEFNMLRNRLEVFKAEIVATRNLVNSNGHMYNSNQVNQVSIEIAQKALREAREKTDDVCLADGVKLQ